jgi:hypothetical protein
MERAMVDPQDKKDPSPDPSNKTPGAEDQSMEEAQKDAAQEREEEGGYQ